MKKFFIILAAVCVAYTASVAHAAVFFGARGGFEKYKVENSSLGLDNGKTDFMAGGFLGYHSGFFRLDAEYLYHPKRRFKGIYRGEAQTVMGNLYFSPAVKSILHPYIMGGAGVAFHSLDVGGSSEKDHTFAWQTGVGVEFEFTDRVFLDVGGRWIDMGDPEHANKKFETTGYNYYVGLRLEY